MFWLTCRRGKRARGQPSGCGRRLGAGTGPMGRERAKWPAAKQQRTYLAVERAVGDSGHGAAERKAGEARMAPGDLAQELARCQHGGWCVCEGSSNYHGSHSASLSLGSEAQDRGRGGDEGDKVQKRAGRCSTNWVEGRWTRDEVLTREREEGGGERKKRKKRKRKKGGERRNCGKRGKK